MDKSSKSGVDLKPSRYLARKFHDLFTEPCEFWTGEDGTLLSLVICRRPDWVEVVRQHWAFEHEPFDPSRGVEKYVCWKSPEDRESWPGIRRTWQISDAPTPFPVIEYELQIPR